MNRITFDECDQMADHSLTLLNLTSGRDDFIRPRETFFQSFARKRLLSTFGNLQQSHIAIQDQDETWALGVSNRNGLHGSIVVNHPQFYTRILTGGTIGAAEAFIDGHWDSEDLTTLIRIFVQNMPQMHGLEKTWARIKNGLHRLTHLKRRNTREGSRKNIGDHYDLGNDFYRLFLDPTMNYSSGIFPTSGSSMQQASIRKMDWIGKKLRLSTKDHLLEIGTGWGGLAIFLATTFGCRITTTTISRQQFEYAKRKVNEAGLDQQINVILSDYRDLDGSFDKIVSVEMIEAVGHEYYDEYFGRCSAMLKDDGLMLIQAITISEQNFKQHIRNIDFIRRYVFPGGSLPSITAIGASIGRATDMRITHLDDITEHYVQTLRHWRNEFHRNMEKIRSLGYDQDFVRLWHFYLCYCEAGFAERRVHNTQIMFAKPNSTTDPAVEFSTELSKSPFESGMRSFSTGDHMESTR